MAEAGGLLGWLGASTLAQTMRGSLWMYPIVEIVHIFGFAILVGAIAMFDIRVLGFARHLPVRALASLLSPWALAALLLIVPAGLMMFSAHPHDFATSSVFRLKLVLILVAGLNALLFHIGVYRSVGTWNTAVIAPPLARMQAGASLLLWIAILGCGRLLAYT